MKIFIPCWKKKPPECVVRIKPAYAQRAKELKISLELEVDSFLEMLLEGEKPGRFEQKTGIPARPKV